MPASALGLSTASVRADLRVCQGLPRLGSYVALPLPHSLRIARHTRCISWKIDARSNRRHGALVFLLCFVEVTYSFPRPSEQVEWSNLQCTLLGHSSIPTFRGKVDFRCQKGRRWCFDASASGLTVQRPMSVRKRRVLASSCSSKSTSNE